MQEIERAGFQEMTALARQHGFGVANPENAMQAYARLRTADRLTVSVNRGGKVQNIDVNIK